VAIIATPFFAHPLTSLEHTMSNNSLGLLDAFGSISLFDFEFRSIGGNRQEPVCMVVKDARSGVVRRYWQDDLRKLDRPPFPAGPTDLVVAYYASAEFGCMLELGWESAVNAVNAIDLFAEHRTETNGLYLPTGNSFLGALAMRGLTRIDVAVKDAMRDKILSQSSWSPAEQVEILDYCTSDVEGLDVLLSAMLPKIDLPRALLRGRYTKAVARMERAGIPIDTEVHGVLVSKWQDIRRELIAYVDRDYGVYDGETFKQARFAEYLRRHRIPWIKSERGALKLDEETFREQAIQWPILEPLRELRQALGKMYLPSLQIGRDNRCRTLLGPFASKTGRNQPSTKKFPFALSRWQRPIIKPPRGWGVSYIDYSSQEIAIAGGRSGDERLIQAYNAGDPYLAFAKQCGVAPPDATRESHAAIRNQCKTVVLGLNYGLGAEKMAHHAGISTSQAHEFIQRHRQTYPRYWAWNDGVVQTGLMANEMSSLFGFRRQLQGKDRPTSLMNFPMQADGAEMMRLAAIAGTEAGIEVCAPIHDAFLISAPLEVLDEHVAKMRDLMTRASLVITGTVPVRTDAKTIRFPDRYVDQEGVDMWNLVVELAGIPDKQV
jgi:DNA polymerase-1